MVRVRARSVLLSFATAAVVLGLATAAGAQDPDWTQVGDDILGDVAQRTTGGAIAVNFDGTRVVSGESFADSGQVRVFDLVDGTWTQVGQDLTGDDTGDFFGTAVDISADGSRILVGIPFDSEAGERAGQIKVFDLVDGVWTQVGQAINGESEGDEFGEAVSMSGDGQRIVAGARYNDGNGDNAGQVRVYSMFGDAWAQVGGDIEGQTGRSLLGNAVAISADGQVLAAGATASQGGGQIRVFVYVDGAWVQAGSAISGEVDGDVLGDPIAISANGTQIAAATPFNDDAGEFAGHVRVFGWFGDWVQVGPDIDGKAANEVFGWSVAMSADGRRIAVGAPQVSVIRNDTGLVRIYDFTDGTWLQTGADIVDDSSPGDMEDGSDNIGVSVAMSASGERVFVGASGWDAAGEDSGLIRAYEYQLAAPPVVDPEPGLTVMCGGVEATIVGTPDDDILEGTDGADVIAGLQGNDQIRGLGGDDILCGGVGDDTIYGGQGFDIMFGAQGDDIIFSANGNTGALRTDVRGMRAFGGAGDDSIYGSDRWDRMQGGPGTDRLFGYEGRDWMRGGAGPDDIDGGIGVDDLHGGNGNDAITVTNGDTVRGGAGPSDACEITGTPKRMISCELRN